MEFCQERVKGGREGGGDLKATNSYRTAGSVENRGESVTRSCALHSWSTRPSAACGVVNLGGAEHVAALAQAPRGDQEVRVRRQRVPLLIQQGHLQSFVYLEPSPPPTMRFK